MGDDDEGFSAGAGERVCAQQMVSGWVSRCVDGSSSRLLRTSVSGALCTFDWRARWAWILVDKYVGCRLRLLLDLFQGPTYFEELSGAILYCGIRLELF